MLELVIAARDGSKTAFESLLNHYLPLLRSVAQQELPQMLAGKVAPSSIVQQSCIDALKDIQSLRATTESECRAWLIEIVRKNIADANRKFVHTEKRNVAREISLALGGSHPLLEKLVSADPAPDGSLIAREDRERLDHAIANLSEECQLIIHLRSRDHLSFVEIGEKLGKAPDAVRMMWNRAVKQLATELSRDPTN